MNALDWLASKQQAVISRQNLTGLTACSQLIQTISPLTHHCEQFVLRQQTQRATDFGINYAQEAQILQHLAVLSFVPKVYYTSSESSLLHWIEGEIPNAFTLPLLSQLAKILAELHQFPINSKLPRLDLADRCFNLWNRLTSEKKQSLDFRPPFKAVKPFGQVLCHHDVHLGNLIQKNDRLYLIDWEYSAISDPALEIAMLFSTNELTDEQKAFFLKEYLKNTKFDEETFQQKMAEYDSAIEKLNQLWFALSE